MKVEQIYTGCLAEAAYYIESKGEAAIIDPLRETRPYIWRAEKDQAVVKYIFETHFHADFVSGHLELAQKTGAKIVYGPKAGCKFDCYGASDGEEFILGDVVIKAIHTPGHTEESTCYLLSDENGKPYCLFTGDTLFIGDVGRPDLAIKSDVTEDDLAGMLYGSLREKILSLPDELIIYPAHGAGSACGKHMSSETSDTLGHQKKVNYALQDMSKEKFIQLVTTGLLPAPQYFSKNAMLNKEGVGNMDRVYKHGLKKLDPDEFELAMVGTGALVLDTRDQEVFATGFIPGSINIGLNGQFAPWVGTLITELKQAILIVCDEGREEETVLRLARVGYDNAIGYLSGGMEQWRARGKKADAIRSVHPEEFEKLYNENILHVLDVRRPAEYEAEHVDNAENRPLDFINEWTPELSRDQTYYLHCAGGYRSMVTASILKARGFDKIVDVAGGYSAISKTNVAKIALTI